jgi:hypothetical protein
MIRHFRRNGSSTPHVRLRVNRPCAKRNETTRLGTDLIHRVECSVQSVIIVECGLASHHATHRTLNCNLRTARKSVRPRSEHRRTSSSTEGTHERAVAGVTSGLIGLNDEVTWEARHLGVRQRLTVRVTAFNRPQHFQDTMVAGAFKSMRRSRVFRASK